ncbi:DNA replication endonuclease-helicase Dna2 [Desmophyllum pertusum]|uniref:DNA replication endonuclease-helicase Dna2 n=1 Tax=Desmophyllum pertusum TaxID=174260 RepID=A0A9X0A0F3_9CNID|nr:DNA replication endonuclease-helicase Dna2 [Desmophyllum pertusum]
MKGMRVATGSVLDAQQGMSYRRLMPAMLRDLNTCRRCSQAQNCTTFHKAAEQGDSMTSGLAKFFDEMTGHMTNTYVNYFTNWYKLVCLEGKEMEQKRNQGKFGV